jgi:hypothetical protein
MFLVTFHLQSMSWRVGLLVKKTRTFRPRQVQHPALERCDRRGGLPDVDADDRPRDELEDEARGAKGGSPPLRCEEEEASSRRSPIARGDGSSRCQGISQRSRERFAIVESQ